MANNEEGKPSKSEKSPSPAQLMYLNLLDIEKKIGLDDQTNQASQTNIQAYPDWAAMQPMMPPYGAPYAAIYPHGGVYAHPGVPLGSHGLGQGVPLSPAVSEAFLL
ncbi:g-box-binding factor 3 [Quercus suber]|uniref:G-box-binding factor 3 n=1 Tax=Quercus suber TaxID=58331 RepID=A0AAW0ILU8_QUESU